MVFVGAGILDGPGCGAVLARQGCRALRMLCCTLLGRITLAAGSGYAKRTPSTTRYGVGMASFGFAGDCAICGWRFGRLGISRHARRRYLARCDGAGISLAAASGSFARCDGQPGALPPGPLRFGQRAAGWQEVSARNFVSEQGPASPPYWMYGKKLGRSYGAKGPATPADTPVVSCPIEKNRVKLLFFCALTKKRTRCRSSASFLLLLITASWNSPAATGQPEHG